MQNYERRNHSIISKVHINSQNIAGKSVQGYAGILRKITPHFCEIEISPIMRNPGKLHEKKITSCNCM